MRIILNHSSMVPIYEQLMEQIKSEIFENKLKENEALPSVRTLAGELRISALTVKKAYDVLCAEQISCATDLKVSHGNFKTTAELRVLFDRSETFLCDFF